MPTASQLPPLILDGSCLTLADLEAVARDGQAAPPHPLPPRAVVRAREGGDRAPRAHLALAMIGEGPCARDGRVVAGREALRAAGLEPARLEAKEGLALINGTQLMTALAGLALAEATRLAATADVAGALTL